MKKIIIISILLILASLAIAQDKNDPTTLDPYLTAEQQFAKQMADLGITVANCQGCSFDGSNTITLAPGASAENVPQGMRVQVAHGTVKLEDQSEVTGDATLTTSVSKSKVYKGRIKHKRKPKQKTKVPQPIEFEQSEVEFADAQVVGSGKILDGKLIVESGKMKINSLTDQPIEFINTDVEVFGTSIAGKGTVIDSKLHLLDANVKYFDINVQLGDVELKATSDESKSIALISANEGARIGVESDHLKLDPNRPFVIDNSKNGIYPIFLNILTKTNSKGEEESIPPKLVVTGKPSFFLYNQNDFLRKEVKPEVVDSEGVVQSEAEYELQPIELELNGKKHQILGAWQFYEGNVRTIGDKYKELSMVDGIYLKPWQSVEVYFDDQPRTGDYISIGEKLTLGGNTFTAALSSGKKGYLNSEYAVEFPTSSKFAPQMSGSAGDSRLVFDFTVAQEEIAVYDPETQRYKLKTIDVPNTGRGGEVELDPKNNKAKISGSVQVTNGISKITYINKEDKTIYNTKFVPCNEYHSTCGTTSYIFEDGGVIDFNTGSGVDQPAVKLHRETFSVGEQEVEVELDEGKLYYADYYGGSAAEAIAKQYGYPTGEEDSAERAEYDTITKAEQGHSGILLYLNGQLWVTEADGTKTVVRPFDKSLFANGDMAALYQVVDDEGNPVSSETARTMSRVLAGGGYDYFPYTEDKHCAEVAFEIANACLMASSNQEFKPRVKMQNWRGDAARKLVAQEFHKNLFEFYDAPLPRALSESPNSDPIFTSTPKGRVEVFKPIKLDEIIAEAPVSQEPPS